MKYMLLIIGSQDAYPVTSDEDQGLMEAFMAYHKAVRDAGVMVDSNVLDSFETATSVQVDSAGERIVTDGPFTETKEHMGGFWILEAANMEEALSWARKGAVACRASGEVREILFRPAPEQVPAEASIK